MTLVVYVGPFARNRVFVPMFALTPRAKEECTNPIPKNRTRLKVCYKKKIISFCEVLYKKWCECELNIYSGNYLK
ncbi:hypothetical protein HanLR1_Chr04g0133261 [Helianthus annuus]|nr:hypothetical protein HanLR1_Chr04g0133261 [Helianthus annuus]